MPFTALEQKEHRRRLAALGICTHCHDRPARPKLKQCQPCVDHIQTNLRYYKSVKWRSEGKCVVCGKLNPDAGFFFKCARCSDPVVRAMQEIRRGR